jgi:hypothetical protein
MKNYLSPFLFLLSCFSLGAQNSFTFERKLLWANTPTTYILADGSPFEVWKFEGCSFGDEARSLPVFSERFALVAKSELEVEIVSVNWEVYAKKTSPDDKYLTKYLNINTLVEHERNKFFGRVTFIPLRKVGSNYERATSITLNIRIKPLPVSPTPALDRGGPFTYTSVLSSGNIYKFGVGQNGIYKLDYAFLKNQLGINDLDNIDPRSIRLYGNGGNMLPEKNSDARPDDLTENAIKVVGE